MNDHEIQMLKARVAKGDVWWRDVNTGVCKPVARVDLNWIEFPDQPDLAEPAARLHDGGAVALYNVDADSFVTLSPCLEHTGELIEIVRTMRKHGFSLIQDRPGIAQPDDDQMQRAQTVARALLAAHRSTNDHEIDSLAKALLQTADATRSLSQFR